MNIKRNLAALFVFVAALMGAPSLAFAAEVSTFTVKETMSFNPLWYLTAMIGVGLIVAIVVTMVTYRRYKQQQKMLCRNYKCQNNPLAQVGIDDFDYRKIETPSEFLVQAKCQAQQQATQATDVDLSGQGTHFRDGNQTNSSQPAIQLVPPMKHLKTNAASFQSQEAVNLQIEALIRRIS